MPRSLPAALLLAGWLAGTAAGDAPRAELPKLDTGPAALAPPTPEVAEPARRLPPTVAVCQDRAARRCWLAPEARDCRTSEAPAGEIFRLVIDDAARREAGTALADCRAALERPTSP
jgi:hypothetical protein